MSDADKGALILTGMFFAFGFMFGLICGIGYTKNSFESEAIEHNAAQYNPKTKEFEWFKNEDNKTVN